MCAGKCPLFFHCWWCATGIEEHMNANHMFNYYQCNRGQVSHRVWQEAPAAATRWQHTPENSHYTTLLLVSLMSCQIVFLNPSQFGVKLLRWHVIGAECIFPIYLFIVLHLSYPTTIDTDDVFTPYAGVELLWDKCVDKEKVVSFNKLQITGVDDTWIWKCSVLCYNKHGLCLRNSTNTYMNL